MRKRIQEDFIVALKAQDTVAKAAISGLKAKLTEAEKSSSKELSENDVIKVVINAIKQRTQSRDAFIDAGRDDLADQEQREIDILERYAPKQMSDAELQEALQEIIQGLPELPNAQAKVGKTIGEFNKKFPGQAEPKTVAAAAAAIINQ